MRIVFGNGGKNGNFTGFPRERNAYNTVRQRGDGNLLITGADFYLAFIRNIVADHKLGGFESFGAVEIVFNARYRLIITIHEREGLRAQGFLGYAIIILRGQVQSDIHEVVRCERKLRVRCIFLGKDILVGIDLNLGKLYGSGHANKVCIEGRRIHFLSLRVEDGEFIVALITFESLILFVNKVDVFIGQVTCDVVRSSQLDLGYLRTFQIRYG